MQEAFVRCGNRIFVPREKTLVMGILNVTPDSFSDGGRYVNHHIAIEYGQQLIESGADIVDIGGESTAPFAKPTGLDEELRRVIPVVEGLKRIGITNISIDTMKAVVAKEALRAGASWINDQSAALNDPAMPSVMAEADAVVIMHNGGGATSGVDAGEGVVYDEVIESLVVFFKDRIAELTRAGVSPKNVIVDPGICFGKGLNDSLTIINHMDRFRGLGGMSLIGVSRKSFIGKLTGITNPQNRDFASLGAEAAAIRSGANIVRTHHVKAAVDMARILDACWVRENHEDLYKAR